MQINNGVYKSGFSISQTAYDKAQQELYAALDTVERRLSQHRFLIGDREVQLCAHAIFDESGSGQTWLPLPLCTA